MGMVEQGPGEDFVDRTQKALVDILSHMNDARNLVASIHDAVFEGQNDDGVPLLPYHRLYNRAVKLTVAIPEEPILLDIIDRCTAWESKYDRITNHGNGKPTLASIHDLLLSSNKFPIRLKSVVRLEAMVAKCLEVRRATRERRAGATQRELVFV